MSIFKYVYTCTYIVLGINGLETHTIFEEKKHLIIYDTETYDRNNPVRMLPLPTLKP
jgi:hypothetical protein